MSDQSKGVALSMFTECLKRVPAHRARNPMTHAEVVAALDPAVVSIIRRDHSSTLDAETVRRLPRRHLEGLTFEQIARFRASNFIMMSKSMEDMMAEDARFVLLDRIRSSMHHWGSGTCSWNEHVDAYNAIRSFSFGIDGFEARATHVSTYRKNGECDHCDTWLDGHLGFLIHHEGRHVLTIGFSIVQGRRVLIQQIQASQPRGNRWLFRIPDGVVQHVVKMFLQNFPQHAVHLVDGADLADENIRNYEESLVKQQRIIEGLRRQKLRSDVGDGVQRRLNKAAVIEDELILKIEDLRRDASRLKAAYDRCGPYRLGAAFTVNKMRHYAIAA